MILFLLHKYISFNIFTAFRSTFFKFETIDLLTYDMDLIKTIYLKLV